MYKKLLPALCFTFSALAASAQIPTLTSTTNPQIGDWQLVYGTDSFNVGSSGAGVTWNFSTLPINTTDTTYASACSTSPYCSTFPGTTVYAHTQASTSYLFYNTTTTTFSIAGEYSTGAIPYSNYEDILRYPFTYNSTYVDSFAATYVSGSSTFNRSGAITVTADGYGTLILPNGTFTNALRIHRSENYSDSMVGFPFGFSYLTDIYTWYVPGIRQALLSQTQLTIVGSGPTPKTAFFTNQTPSLGASNLQMTDEAFILYPNPVKDELNIEFMMDQPGYVHISISDIIGRNVAIITNGTFNSGKQHFSYPTSSLQKGLYIVKMQTENETVTRKIEIF